MRTGVRLALALSLVLTASSSCDNLAKQPVDKTWRPANAWPDRDLWPLTPPAHTVAREDRVQPAPPVTLSLLERGRERFEAYCTPCHGYTGDGHGMIVQRGFPAPPSFHGERLRAAPTQHFYDVMSNGWGAMFSYADRVVPRDRWAIAAYIRALQESRQVVATSLPPAVQAGLR